VLLKGFDERGFVFYTNYKSHKGQELADNPQAARLLVGGTGAPSSHIEGRVEKVSDQESDEYFHSRPFSSRLSAWASDQSQVISAKCLSYGYRNSKPNMKIRTFPTTTVGGFRVIPTVIEFWQGRPSRLHDRLNYHLLNDGSWFIERLSP